MEACRNWPDRLYGMILPNNSHGPGRRRRRNDDDEEAANVCHGNTSRPSVCLRNTA